MSWAQAGLHFLSYLQREKGGCEHIVLDLHNQHEATVALALSEASAAVSPKIFPLVPTFSRWI